MNMGHNKTLRTAEQPWHMVAHQTAVPTAEPIKAEFHRIEVPHERGAQHNPSVFVVNGELRAVVRVLHGTLTTNYVGRVMGNWTFAGIRRITCKEQRRGQIEDIRMFSWRGGLWGIAAAHQGDSNPPSAIRQILLKFNPDGTEIESLYLQPSSRHEKNWMPCVAGDALRFVYSTDPLIVLSGAHLTQDEYGPCDKYGVVPPATEIPQVSSFIRGGSQLVPWEGGWLALVHQVYRPSKNAPNYNPLLGGWAPTVRDPVAGDKPVVYLHRFVRFDGALQTVAFSHPFYFREIGIEFAAGLAPWQDGFVASFGVADKEAWLAEIKPETIDELFVDVPPIHPEEVPEPKVTIPHVCRCDTCGRTLPR